jgi:hypothetical protein
MTELQRVIYQTVHASVEDPTIFVIVNGPVRGERQYFARDVVTHRAVRTPDETVVGTVWRGAFTPEPWAVS